MKHRIIIFICLICLLFVGFGTQPEPVIAAGNIYYVAKTGLDSNDGSFAHPWLTITHAISQMVAGDTLNVETGIYNESVGITINGDSSHWTTVQNYNNETVTLDGTGINYFICFYNCSYINFSGFQVQNAPGYCVLVEGVSHYINITNLTISNTTGPGIKLQSDQGTPYEPGNIGNIVISGCHLSNVCTAHSEEGISIVNTDSFEVKNCYVTNANGQDGMDAKVGSTNGSFHNNEFDGTSLYLDCFGHDETNINVYGNLFHNSQTGGAGMALGCENAPATMSGINIYNNIFYGNYRGFSVNPAEAGYYYKSFNLINNTFYENAAAGLTEVFLADANDYTNCVISNNIIVGLTATSDLLRDPYNNIGNGVTVSYNLFYDAAGYSSFNAYGANHIIGNPLLMNPTTDFSLQAGSPAINAGTSTNAPSTDYIGTARPQGAGYDIGAYEYIASKPPAVTTSAASSVTTSGATLNGSLTTLGSTSPVTVSFDWGTDTSYTDGNIAGNPSSITSVPTAFTASLSGLTPGTTYHYQAKAVGTTTVYGSDQQFTTSTSPAALAITTSSLPNGTVGAAYSQTLAATGGTTPYTWSIASGTLPAGLTLSSGGVISGTPTTAGGPTSVTFKVTDSASATATKPLSITINSTPPSITTSSLPNGTVGVAYSQTLAVTGGTTPYTWTIASGTLPAGLTLSSGGVISGTPTTAGGPTSVTFQVTDSTSATATKSLSITVAYAAWDVNMDGAVNVLDMISVSQHMGETGTPGWIRQDVNGDGVINVLDEIAIGQHWTG